MEINSGNGQESLHTIKMLYEDILELSIRQNQLLEPGQEISWPMEAMFKLKDERQDIMQHIDEMDAFFGSSPASLPLYATGGGDLEILLQMRNIIQAIEVNDHICQDSLEEGKQKMMSKLSSTRENKKAQIAYTQEDVYAPAWFFDKKK